MINIHGKTDPNYRYTMHKLQSMCKRNNKTYFLNLQAVATNLARSPDEIFKWFGYTYGVQGNLKEYALNGKFETAALQTKLQDYIDNHVLCGVCGNPETKYQSKTEKGVLVSLSKKCSSCGGTSAVKLHPKMLKIFDPVEKKAYNPLLG